MEGFTGGGGDILLIGILSNKKVTNFEFDLFQISPGSGSVCSCRALLFITDY